MNLGQVYVLLYSPGAKRDLCGLPNQILRRIDPKILALSLDPRPPGCLKLVGSTDLYRIRVGDYRIIYKVDDVQRHVTLTVISHRRESYR